MNIGQQSFLGIVIKAFSIVAGFLVVATLARVMSPSVYGLYSTVLALLTVLAIPTAMGLPNYVVRETAKALEDANEPLVRWILVAAVTLVLIVAAMVVFGVLVCTFLMTDTGIEYGRESFRYVLWLGLGLVPVMALTQVTGAALRGIGHSTPGLLVGQVFRHLLFLILLSLWVLLPIDLTGGLTAVSAMGLHVMAAAFALGLGCIGWAFLRPAPALSCEGQKTQINVRAMLTSIVVMGIIAGAQTLNDNLDVIMVGALVNMESAGLYKLASTAALVTVAGLQAINMVFMPHFARIHQQGNTDALQRLATRSVRMILMTSLPIALILIVFGRPLITLVFGAEYAGSYQPMVILVIGQLVSAFFGSVMTILNMTGHEIDTMKGVLLGSAVNIMMNVVLIPLFGATGAAIATASTLVAWNVYLHYLVRKRLFINSTPFPFLNIAR